MANPSYYFTLFKKFQVMNHVPDKGAHGAIPPATVAGGFDLKDPNSVFGSSNRGSLLGASNNPADSPLWAVLNAKANGLSGPIFGGTTWPPMPAFDTPAWLEFQINALFPKLLVVFGNWITAGKIDDIPEDVILTVPGPIKQTVAGIDLFVCSVAGDTGERPGTVPSNYWATSLIFLVDPATGNTATPSQLSSSSEYYLTAVIGNRGNANAGRFADPSGARVDAACWVMVWNSGMSPAVQLPALSNLDVTSTDGIYESFFLDGGRYDIVGFRLNVQDVFNGLVKAISESGTDLGGLTPAEWVHAQGAHLCVKVLVRAGNDPWPTLGDTPFTDKRIGQRNLAPFTVDLSVTDPDPDIHWTNFMVGDVIQFLTQAAGFGERYGWHKLIFRPKFRAGGIQLYLAVPLRSLKRWTAELKFIGFKQVKTSDLKGIKLPFPECQVYELTDEQGVLEVPPLHGEFLALSLGIGYSVKQLKAGELGVAEVEQKTMALDFDKKRKSCEIVELSVGGFTLEVSAKNPQDWSRKGG